MSTYKPGTDEKQSGKIVYNAGIVKGIVALAVNEVEGTLPLPNNKSMNRTKNFLRLQYIFINKKN